MLFFHYIKEEYNDSIISIGLLNLLYSVNLNAFALICKILLYFDIEIK